MTPRRRTQKKPISLFTRIFCPLCAVLFAACSFDYGDGAESGDDRPDIVMEDIEYVRVRGGEPSARFKAEYAERWEERQIMELKSLSFEQMEDEGETVNAAGRAGAATVQLNSGNISLREGVRLNIESEDIDIRTGTLDWQDKEKTLKGGDEAEVDIARPDGTNFTGRGFSADIRSRTWDFSGTAKGTYVEEEDAEGEEEAAPAVDGAATQAPADSAPSAPPPPVPAAVSPDAPAGPEAGGPLPLEEK